MEKFKNVIKFTTFIILTLFLIIKVGVIFTPDRTSENIKGTAFTVKGFYKMPKNSIDVLFMGDSSIYKAIYPMEMWEKHGIASYNYSVNSLRPYGANYLLLDALKYQHPELIIIDPDTFFYKYKFSEPQQRSSVDYMKNSKIKYDMVNDNHYEFTFEDKVSAFFPLLRYHSRWNDMSLSEVKKVVKDYSSVTRGSDIVSDIKPNIKHQDYMEKYDNKKKFENDSIYYLDKINDLCQEKNIKLLILQVPEALAWGQKQAELISNYANENNIDLLDLNTIDIGINWMEDTKDKGSHLNVLGALKVTDYVGNYLKKNYNLKNHKDEKDYEFWNDDYIVYKELRDKHIENAKKNVEKVYQIQKEKNN